MIVHYSVVDQAHDITAERPVRGHDDTSVPHGLRDCGEVPVERYVDLLSALRRDGSSGAPTCW